MGISATRAAAFSANRTGIAKPALSMGIAMVFKLCSCSERPSTAKAVVRSSGEGTGE